MRVVLDTNVLVSAIFFAGIPGRILAAWSEGRFEMLATVDVLTEYRRVVARLERRFPSLEAHASLTHQCHDLVPAEPKVQAPDLEPRAVRLLRLENERLPISPPNEDGTLAPGTFQQGGQLLSRLRIGIDLHLSTSTTGISSARATRSRVASRATSAHRCCSAHVKTYASHAYKPCSVASVMAASRSTSRKRN
jgi:hypothetical protein